jgi:glutathione S-transferase
MKLYITPGSLYARMARIVIAEKGLAHRVEVVQVQPRVVDSPYYSINPSGRVPYLVRDDGVGMEESALICDYLDQIDGRPLFRPPAGEQGWESRRLEALARSTMDGLAVWARELRRPEQERSPTLLSHEAIRFGRLADVWEREIGHSMLGGVLNMPQITLACALGFDLWVPGLRWRVGRPKLAAWFDRISALPSFVAVPQGPLH